MSKTESFAEISQAIEHLAAIPTTAKTLADANAIRDIAESVGKRLRHLSTAIEPYRGALDETRQPGTVVTIGEQEASNAHDAAIAYAQAWYFALWSAVDFDGWMRALTDPSIRFDPVAIEDQAEKAIEHCQSWPDDGWQGVVAQIAQERAHQNELVIHYGPHPNEQGIIYWEAKPIRVTPTSWKFLAMVWGKKDVPFADIGERVWGDDTTSPSTIRSRATRASNELWEHEIDLQFSCDGEKVSPLNNWPK